MAHPTGRVLTLKQLQENGWLPYGRQHVSRLVKDGKLPAPRKAYPGGRTNVWDADELGAFLHKST
jgi:hypothetical protein